MIKIGLMGFGTVGAGVYKIIDNRKDELSRLLKEEIEVKKILVKDLNKNRKLKIDNRLFTDNAQEILDDPQIDIVVEAIGGMNPAYEYICYALNQGKHVVTANKEVVANHMESILELSNKNNKRFLFEASVGGGIPIIKSLVEILCINDITQIRGILNATSNFILTNMMDKGTSFEDSLELARKLGYVEANPKDDLEGDDAVRKLAILSSLAFKTRIDVESILYRGITSITKEDVINFKRMKKSVRLIATAVKKDNRISASVEPVLIEENSQYANVKDGFNIVSIVGNTVQELQFYGLGGGEKPTANAVVSDIVDIFKSQYDIYELMRAKEEYKVDAQIDKRDYYLRVTSNEKNENKIIINCIEEFGLKYEVLENACDFLVKIKSIYADEMERFVIQFKMLNHNFCYVRIEACD